MIWRVCVFVSVTQIEMCKDMQNLMDGNLYSIYVNWISIYESGTPFLSRVCIFRRENASAHIVEISRFMFHVQCSGACVCVCLMERVCNMYNIRLSLHGGVHWHGRCSKTRNISFHLSNIEQLISFRSIRSIRQKPTERKPKCKINKERMMNSMQLESSESKTTIEICASSEKKKTEYETNGCGRVFFFYFCIKTHRNNRFTMVLSNLQICIMHNTQTHARPPSIAKRAHSQFYSVFEIQILWTNA